MFVPTVQACLWEYVGNLFICKSHPDCGASIVVGVRLPTAVQMRRPSASAYEKHGLPPAVHVELQQRCSTRLHECDSIAVCYPQSLASATGNIHALSCAKNARFKAYIVMSSMNTKIFAGFVSGSNNAGGEYEVQTPLESKPSMRDN